MWNKEELLQEAKFRKYKKDPYAFLEEVWKIRHPEKGAILLDLREAQRDTLDVWLAERLSITLKARQIGFSTLAAGLVFWHIFFHEDRFIITLSKTEREAQKLKAKIDYGYKRLPPWLLDRGPKKITDTLAKLEFTNGSSVEALPSTDPARGESAYLIIVDEWAHFEDPESAWAAIEPATDIGGRVVALSSAKGVGNVFHRMVMDAITHSNDFKFIFHSWRAVPERDDAWYDAKRRNLLEWQLHQEYPSTPEEAFIKSGNPVFDVDQLYMIDPVHPRQGYLHSIPSMGVIEYRENSDGPLSLWQMPVENHNYVVGADVAEGLEHGDFSVAHVIDTVSGQVVAKWRGHVEPDVFGTTTLYDLGMFYNKALVGVEVNNHGLTTVVNLNQTGYGNIYYRHTYDQKSKKRGVKMGWHTSVVTKPLMIDELAKALRFSLDQDEMVVEEAAIDLLDEATIGELVTYVRDEKGKMHGSPFDDQVISLAIAVQMLKHYSTPETVKVVDDTWTLDWWCRQGDQPQGDWVIGRFASA